MKRILALLFVIAALGLTGCASKHMQKVAATPGMGSLQESQAGIVFFRDTSFGGAIQAPIAEAKDNTVAFVGIVSANSKILHKTTPGKHVYIVGGESSSLLEADLAPGKFYYVRVEPKMGAWKARFRFESISNAVAVTEDFRKDLTSCDWYSAKPEAMQWFNDNKQSMLAKALEAQKENTAPGSKGKAIIYPGFGIDRLIQ